MHGSTWQPANCTHATIGGVTGCFELPVLQALPAYDLAVSGLPPIASTPLGFPLPLVPGTPTSCYIDETLGLTNPTPSLDKVQNPTTRCLRFTELRFSLLARRLCLCQLGLRRWTFCALKRACATQGIHYPHGGEA